MKWSYVLCDRKEREREIEREVEVEREREIEDREKIDTLLKRNGG